MYSHPRLTIDSEMRSVQERFGLHDGSDSVQGIITKALSFGLTILFLLAVAIQSSATPKLVLQETADQLGISGEGIVLQTFRGR